jgi:hypothetical protein
MPDLDATKPWIQNSPEQRLSVATYRLLKRTLLSPKYITAIHDSDGGGRSDLQRIRDANRGITTGQLDFDVVQGVTVELRDGTSVVRALCRKLELKRGKNTLSPRQKITVSVLTACGAPPIIAWTLAEVHDGLKAAGFRFGNNVGYVLPHLEEELGEWDRKAEAILSGEIIQKRQYAGGRPKERTKPGLTWKL